jgi:hypothetical protein
MDLQLPLKSVPITTNVWVLRFPSNKTDRHDVTEILLKVALNTRNQTKPHDIL